MANHPFEFADAKHWAMAMPVADKVSELVHGRGKEHCCPESVAVGILACTLTVARLLVSHIRPEGYDMAALAVKHNLDRAMVMEAGALMSALEELQKKHAHVDLCTTNWHKKESPDGGVS